VSRKRKEAKEERRLYRLFSRGEASHEGLIHPFNDVPFSSCDQRKGDLHVIINCYFFRERGGQVYEFFTIRRCKAAHCHDSRSPLFDRILEYQSAE
jgi:hypothetical protein